MEVDTATLDVEAWVKLLQENPAVLRQSLAPNFWPRRLKEAYPTVAIVRMAAFEHHYPGEEIPTATLVRLLDLSALLKLDTNLAALFLWQYPSLEVVKAAAMLATTPILSSSQLRGLLQIDAYYPNLEDGLYVLSSVLRSSPQHLAYILAYVLASGPEPLPLKVFNVFLPQAVATVKMMAQLLTLEAYAVHRHYALKFLEAIEALLARTSIRSLRVSATILKVGILQQCLITHAFSVLHQYPPPPQLALPSVMQMLWGEWPPNKIESLYPVLPSNRHVQHFPLPLTLEPVEFNRKKVPKKKEVVEADRLVFDQGFSLSYYDQRIATGFDFAAHILEAGRVFDARSRFENFARLYHQPGVKEALIEVRALYALLMLLQQHQRGNHELINIAKLLLLDSEVKLAESTVKLLSEGVPELREVLQ